MVGLFVLAYAEHFWILLAGAALIGIGSADLPSRILARCAARLRRPLGLAQSLFQVGGNFGQSLGPLLAAFIVVPFGQDSVAWFAAHRAARHRRAVGGRRLVCAIPRATLREAVSRSLCRRCRAGT